MDGHAGDVVADHLALARVHAHAHLHAQLARLARHRQRAAQRARRRPVERSEEAVADRLHRAAAEACELLAHSVVVACEQVAPAPVAEVRCARCRIHDVREHHRQQRARQPPPAASACQELLDLLEDRVAVAEERERVPPLELDVARARDVLREVARVAQVPHELASAVHHERRHRDPRERLAHVEVHRRARHRQRLARARRQSLQPREPRAQQRVVLR